MTDIETQTDSAQRRHAISELAAFFTGGSYDAVLFSAHTGTAKLYMALRSAFGITRPMSAGEATAAIERTIGPADGNPHDFSSAARRLQRDVHATAQASGWWDNPPEAGTSIALMHSELSEGLEALRTVKMQDDHLPQFTGIEAELADVVIRILDFSEAHSLRTIEAIVAKAEYNKTRPRKHGGKLF